MKHGTHNRKAEAATASQSGVDPKWRWHYKTLLAIQDRLLEERPQRLAGAALEPEVRGSDQADSATDDFDRDLTLGMLSAEEDALSEVREAIKRIETGDYGICAATTRPIPASRLRAVPWTRFCKQAELLLEESGTAAHRRLGELRSIRETRSAASEGEEEP